MNTIKQRFLWAMVTGMALAAGSAQAAPFYTVTDLGTLSGTFSAATGINASGQVVGFASTAGNAAYHAVKWSPGLPIADLGTLGGTNSYAIGINASGQVVGYSNTTGDAADHAVEWSPGLPIADLGTLGGTDSRAFGINASGQVVGWSNIAGNAAYHAVKWSPGGGITDLNSQIDSGLGWTLQIAVAINDSGQIAGEGTSPSGETHAFLLTPPLTSKDQCKKDGWKAFGFKNQGQCIQFVNTGK